MAGEGSRARAGTRRSIAEHSDDPSGRTYDVDGDPSLALVLLKEAAKRLHPDVGGDPELFRRLTEARDLIEVVA